MKYRELVYPLGTKALPYVGAILMNPTKFDQFLRLTDGHEDVKILEVDRSTCDHWTVFVACASEDGRDLLESNW
jgi:hypothetical protein